MSELMNAQKTKRDFRLQLLTTVSSLALLMGVYGASESRAADEDIDSPTIWIEFGGGMNHVSGQGASFAPRFLSKYSNSVVLQSTTPLQAQNPVPLSFSEEGKITFQPESSDWLFSVGVNYGRSGNSKHVQHQTYGSFFISYKYGIPPANEGKRFIDKFADTHTSRTESHAILDFQVGKDVGLGVFGKDSSSIINLGVRFAQFVSNATFDIRARPNLQFKTLTLPTFHATFHLPYFHTYHATGHASRSFHGVGPSLSWSNSTPLAGNSKNGEVIFDWCANAALLFGRQKTRAQHQESAHYAASHFVFTGQYFVGYQHPPAGHAGARTVAVPNIGGFAGASYRIENFKVSLGYRADFFFGAIDGGIDTRKSENVGFYGPFASISVGLGG
jgi:iron complex outermembrane receptor protein